MTEKLEFWEVTDWSSELAHKIAERLDMTEDGFVKTRDEIEDMLREYLREEIKAVGEDSKTTYSVSVDQLYPVSADSEEEAISKAHDRISERGIDSTSLKIVDISD